MKTITYDCLLLALVVSLLLATLISTLLLFVIDRKHLANHIFHLTRVRLHQRSLWKLEDHLSLVVGRRIGLVARVARDHSHAHGIFRHIDVDLHGIDFVPDLEQVRRLLLAKTSHNGLAPHQRKAAGTVNGATFILAG